MGSEMCIRDRWIVGAVRPEFEKEDGMDISKLTDAEILALGKRIQEVLGRQPVSPALAAEFQEAKTKGITDGTGPCAFATRAQAAVMTLRASKK